jgi:hypothetical protein
MTAVSNRRKRFNGLNILRYPYTMFVDGTDYLQIDMMDYVPVAQPATFTETETLIDENYDFDEDKASDFTKFSTTREFSTSGFQSYTRDPGEGFRRNTNKEPLGTVLLPVPSSLQDGNTVNYSDSSMNTLIGAGLGLSMGVMQNVGKLIGQGRFEDAITELKNQGKGALEASGLTVETAVALLTKQFAGSALNLFGGNVTIDQIQARESGQIFNPNMELLFNGPSLRNFTFSFKMTPRSPEESNEIKNIIRFFKKGMAAKAGGSRLFLSTPNVFELRYRKGRGEHPFLNKFKQCFLQNIAVNYTGEGVYSTYNDGTPVSMTMSLQFKELAPIYDVDYESDFAGPLANPDRAFTERNTGFGGVGY